MSDPLKKVRLPPKFFEQQKMTKMDLAQFQECLDEEEIEDSLLGVTNPSLEPEPFPTSQSLNLESKIEEMKLQLAKGHKMFVQANHDLQGISFDQMQFDVGSLNTTGWDDQELEDVLKNSAKDFKNEEGLKKAPEFQEFISIISTLQEGIKTLQQNQNLISDLGKEVRNEINDMRAKSSSYWEGGMVSRKETEEADVYKEIQRIQTPYDSTDSDSD